MHCDNPNCPNFHPGTVGAPEPAVGVCASQGGQSQPVIGPNGEFNICVFPDGSRCDEWALKLNQCKPGTCFDPSGSCAPPAAQAKASSPWPWVVGFAAVVGVVGYAVMASKPRIGGSAKAPSRGETDDYKQRVTAAAREKFGPRAKLEYDQGQMWAHVYEPATGKDRLYLAVGNGKITFKAVG